MICPLAEKCLCRRVLHFVVALEGYRQARRQTGTLPGRNERGGVFMLAQKGDVLNYTTSRRISEFGEWFTVTILELDGITGIVLVRHPATNNEQ